MRIGSLFDCLSLLAQTVEFFLLLFYQREKAVVLLIEFFLPVLTDGVFAFAMGLFQAAKLVGMVETEAKDESVAVVDGQGLGDGIKRLGDGIAENGGSLGGGFLGV